MVTKTFIAALRERLSDKEAAKLRAFIAPRYLKGHDLQEGEFPIQRVVTGDTRRRGAAGFRSVSEIAAVNRCDAELVSLAGAAVVVWSDREPGVRRLLELVKAKGILLHVIGTGSETRLT